MTHLSPCCHTAMVATWAESAGISGFVGRTLELDRVRAAVEGARGGQAGALLVVGDAGVGKTRLVQRVCADRVAGDVLVEVTCLPLNTAGVPLLPLRTALRRLAPELDAPSLAVGPDGGPGLADLDEWVNRTCAGGHTVLLAVDDLHWADEGTLDALMYLLAGPGDRRLAVLLTLRRGEMGSGHPLRRWLADVRRMPCLSEVPVAAFDRDGTRAQLAEILGMPPHESLVGEVHARSGGNAYLTRLLVENLAPDARHLPGGLPDDLGDAVLRPWHAVSTQARALVLTIAIGGEVASEHALARAVQLAGVPPGDVPQLLHEAVDAGVLDLSSDGGYWFHHPLQAEVLEARLAPHERRSLHTVLARACEADLALDEGPPTSARLAATSAVAEHHARAGSPDEAYRWTLRAADLADNLDDGPAAHSLLRRLVELRERVDNAEPSRTALLTRLRASAAELGDHESEFGAVEALLEELDEVTDPLPVSELLVRREHLRFSTGRGFLRVEPVRRAAELSRPWPEAWQHGYALAEVAHASLWADDPDAQDAVAAALERADATGHPRVIAYAYAAAAMGAEFARHSGSAGLAARGVAAAAQARDWWGFVHASLWEANGTATAGTSAWAHCLQGRREQLESFGGPHPYLAWMSADEAASLLSAGDWQGCTERLRVALGSDPGAGADGMARLAAARLAAHQGRQQEAEAHLARADELFADTTDFLAYQFDAVRAFVRLGDRDPRGAYDAAMTGALSPGVPPTLCEWLCPLAARALADLAQNARAHGGPPLEDELARVDDLVGRFPHVIADSTFVSPEYRTQLDALDALYGAEVARARRSGDEADRWRRAAELLDGVWPWDAAYATYRAGEAALLGGGQHRHEAATLLRRARTMAVDLRAEPVLREVVELARSARIHLDDVRPAVTRSADERLHGLTTREREVLAHVVAGRTYGEIARALFVSEKTVSSHVSNLLRKTRTSNRVELARLARNDASRVEPTT